MAQFYDGQWYRWTGGGTRPDGWNDGGNMDFLLDGKPHQVQRGSDASASFFDSPLPDRMWGFAGEQLAKFEMVLPETVPAWGCAS